MEQVYINIKKRRIELGMSQEELARKSKVKSFKINGFKAQLCVNCSHR